MKVSKDADSSLQRNISI